MYMARTRTQLDRAAFVGHRLVAKWFGTLDDVHEIHGRNIASWPHTSPHVEGLDLFRCMNGFESQRAQKRDIVRSG